MKRLIFFFISLFGVAQADLYLPGSEIKEQTFQLSEWYTNLDKAMEAAKEEEKILFVAFLGLDWCPWSEKLFTEIFSDRDFCTRLKKEMILTIVNQPRAEEMLALQEKYGVDELPTILLLDPFGNEISRPGFFTMEPRAFAMQVVSILDEYRGLGELQAETKLASLSEGSLKQLYEKARRARSDKYQGRILKVGLDVEKGAFFMLEKYNELVKSGDLKKSRAKKMKREIAKRDVVDDRAVKLRLALLDFEHNANHSKKRRHAKKVIKPLLGYISEFEQTDQENIWQLHFKIAQYLFRKGKVGEAMRHAQQSYECAPIAVRPKIQQTIDYLEGRD